MPSTRTIEDTTVTYFRDEDRLEVLPDKERPWCDSCHGNPMMIPRMYASLIQFLADRDMRMFKECMCREALQLVKLHHSRHTAGDSVTQCDWLNSPYSVYNRAGAGTDLFSKLTPEELRNHVWVVFLSDRTKTPPEPIGRWPRALVVPGPTLETALQRATISADAPYAVGVSLLRVVDALDEYDRARWAARPVKP